MHRPSLRSRGPRWHACISLQEAPESPEVFVGELARRHLALERRCRRRRPPATSQTSKNGSASGLRNSFRRCATWRAASVWPSSCQRTRPGHHQPRVEQVVRHAREGLLRVGHVLGGGDGRVVGMVAEQPAALPVGDALGQRRRVRAGREDHHHAAVVVERHAATEQQQRRSGRAARRAPRVAGGAAAGGAGRHPGTGRMRTPSATGSARTTAGTRAGCARPSSAPSGRPRAASGWWRGRRSRRPALKARHSAQPSSASTSSASGRPSSTANCSGRLCVWSKKATGRSGNGVSDQAKLNSPQPTPSHGWRAISASVLAQIAKRELEMSPLASCASPANTCWLLVCPGREPAPQQREDERQGDQQRPRAARQPPVQQAPGAEHQHAEHAGARGAEHDACQQQHAQPRRGELADASALGQPRQRHQ